MFILFDNLACNTLDLKLCFNDYQTGNFSKNLGYKSYTDYTEHVVDEIINQEEHTASDISDQAFALKVIFCFDPIKVLVILTEDYQF